MSTKSNKQTEDIISLNVSLVDGIYLRVDGEEEKSHKIQWEILKKIGDNTQKLITKVVKNSSKENYIEESNLKIEFKGFYKGSAISAFVLPKPSNLIFENANAYENLNTNLSSILDKLSKGDFLSIANMYPDPKVKNEMIEIVYEFSNSAGTKPFSVVKPILNQKFRELGTIRKISSSQKALLKVEIAENIEENTKVVESKALGKIVLKSTPGGKTTRKITHIYSQKEGMFSLKFDSIETSSRIYNLNYEALFVVKEEKKNFISFENTILDIYACGKSIVEAEEDIFDQFDYTYRRLNEFDDSMLSEHLFNAKTYINMLVNSVKEK